MVASIGVINPSNGKHVCEELARCGERVLSVVGVCSGGDSVHKRGSGVRGGGAGAAAVPGPALVLHGRLHPQVLR